MRAPLAWIALASGIVGNSACGADLSPQDRDRLQILQARYASSLLLAPDGRAPFSIRLSPRTSREVPETLARQVQMAFFANRQSSSSRIAYFTVYDSTDTFEYNLAYWPDSQRVVREAWLPVD